MEHLLILQKFYGNRFVQNLPELTGLAFKDNAVAKVGVLEIIAKYVKLQRSPEVGMQLFPMKTPGTISE
jgi:hypothetical protein